jgi:hypothetical protein
MNWTPAAQITPFGCFGAFSVKGYGWFFVSGPAVIKFLMDYRPMIRLWLFVRVMRRRLSLFAGFR